MLKYGADISHLNEVKTQFLEIDPEGTGNCSKRDLIQALIEANISFPDGFLDKLLQEISEVPEQYSPNEDCELNYEKLSRLIQVYSMAPAKLKKDLNNSDHLKKAMEF